MQSSNRTKFPPRTALARAKGLSYAVAGGSLIGVIARVHSGAS